MSDDIKRLASEILEVLGGASNIESYTHCMTRLRVKTIDDKQIDQKKLKQIDGVLGVIEADTLQIVIGPGKVNKVATAFGKLLKEEESTQLKERAKELKKEARAKSETSFHQILKKIASIFIPLIPALVASGLITGMTKAAIQAGWLNEKTELAQILTLIGGGLFVYLAIFVGINTAKEFGGSPALGGLAGALIINPAIAEVTLFGQKLVPGRGGLIGVMIAAIFIAYMERLIRKRMPASIDIVFTPTLSLLITGLFTYLVFMPLGGWISDGITKLLLQILDIGGIIAGFILGATFLPLVVTGLHQGLTPVHLELINQIGDDPLLPILAMSGAGQVGAALAIYVKTKKKRLKRAVGGALPAGMLGIGEPLIFGVTLPLGRPFLTACLGAGVGGAFQAFFKVATISVGVSGLPLTFLVHTEQIVYYLIGVLIAYLAGFVFTYFFGFNDEMASEFKE
ncbi:PTS transporter subunit EIIC [Thermoflavimicrobium daqui]|uniref:PTS sugar transporter subunit IIC n=1 Tax=Thermoflavimicrobium daqui TaxID=2137476 RepID=A0A364K5K5_9BACL|nr:PTS transporter subunit EIIC [Thermoflavimicrobium daqui]RAL24561.1 PTS sugar transporter subunit IIC [Thermoflavimicrobium daqui]